MQEQLNKVTFLSEINELVFSDLKKYTQVAVLVDENTELHCYPLVKPYLPEHELIRIESGEERKNLHTCSLIWEKLTALRFDRKGFLLNLGGGVIGDMGGFCAATYKRGINFYQMPTTLLSQVDASVGGKLGIDFEHFKNHIGVFRIPDNVLIFPEFIFTLPPRELRSGYAEIIKHALIADVQHWNNLIVSGLEGKDWSKIIAHSVAIKAKVVEQDPKENGLRKILNFGHTVGHGVESYLLGIENRKLLHGEAIAIGMICEAYLSYRRCGLQEAELTQIVDYLLSIYGKVQITQEDIIQIQPYLLQDKKNEGNRINCSLLDRIGNSVYDCYVSAEEINESLEYYRSLSY